MKIMVIDDEEATKSLFNQQFKEDIKNGLFEFTFATSAEEGLQLIEGKPLTDPVLILSDINMPGMSGLQLLKHLKTDTPQRPVMIVTAYGDEVNHKKAMAYKADGFINKPIDFVALREKILKLAPPIFEPQEHHEIIIPAQTTHVLVIDDEPALEALIRQKFRKQIKSREMEFTFAYNGVEALEILEQDKEIGIILTDINMPEMDGLTLLAKLKEMNRIFRSVVISAYGDMENIRTAMNLGASDFITKPIDLHDLEVTLEKIIAQYNILKEGQNAQKSNIESQKELEIASHIQKTFTPSNFAPFPDSHHLEIYGQMYPSDAVGGDFFDFFSIGENHLGFVIADVSGKGVPAALFMTMSKTLFRSTALANSDPDECMKEVNHYLRYNNESMMFVTAFYGILNIATGALSYCNAGHLPPYLLSEDRTLSKIPKEKGIALGIVDEFERNDNLFIKKTIQLKDKETLILYSDGITEAINRNCKIYPLTRLENIIKKYGHGEFPELINNMYKDVTSFTEGATLYDDITFLCLRWNK